METRREFIKDVVTKAGVLSLGLTGTSHQLFASEKAIKGQAAKKITTVRGDIPPGKLGFTSIHEHTIVDLAFMRNHLGMAPPPIPKEMLTLKPENYASLRNGLGIFSDECSTLGDVPYIVKELTAFKRVGGQAICDASPIGLRGDVRDIKAASEQADVHIVCATGLYHANAQPKEFLSKSEKELMAHFEKEIKHGIDGTTIKPGIIKCALQNLNPDNTIHPIELKTFRACAKVAANTGLSLHVHTNRPITSGHIMQAINIAFTECGMKPSRLHIMHLDSYLRTPTDLAGYYGNLDSVRGVNIDLQTKVLDMGVSIGFDSWGSLTTFLPDDYDRVKGLGALLKKGYASQIALGHDVFEKSHGVSYGHTGFTHFAKFVPPILKQLGFGSDVVSKLTVDNPARILAY